jgi:L-lactate dehydrogenase complex protein LldE
VGDKPVRLLKSVRGLTYVSIEDAEQCCGFGGTFSVKNADVSSAMVQEKAQCVIRTDADYCAAIDNSCLMQIGGMLSRMKTRTRTLHLAEILAATDSNGAVPGNGSVHG